MGNLLAKTVEHAPCGKHSDGDGLSLAVKPSGARSWVVRVSVNGRKRDIGIGAWPAVGLAAARMRRDEIKADAKAGRDPTTRRSEVPTFGQAAELVCNMTRPTWRDPRQGDVWLGRLRKHAAPLWHMRADRISRSDVLAVLHPIWHTKPEIARRIRQGIRKVLGWVMAHHEHMIANAAAEGIDAALPRTPKVANHQRAIHYDDVPEAMQRIQGSEASPASKLCLKLLILTGVRSGEARGARWSEMNFDVATWTIPAERMKGGSAEHRVPLSKQTLHILTDARVLDDGSGLIFPSPLRRGHELSAQTPLSVLRTNRIDSTVHGFRTSLRQWLLECSDASWAVAEACLAHTIGNSVERAYVRQADLFVQRRQVMADWADFISASLAKHRDVHNRVRQVDRDIH